MDSEVQFLQSWYQSGCDGAWEHCCGVTIETLATPGWLVTIDLASTPLEDESMETLRREPSAKDWLICEVAHKQFRGEGDPQKLGEILQVFRNWASKPR